MVNIFHLQLQSSIQPIDPFIQVYTNKRMLVGVYLDNGRVSDTPESAETVISETSRKHFLNINKLTNNKHVQFTSTLSRYLQLLQAAHRKNTSCLRKFSPGRKPMFCIELFLLTLDWADLPGAQYPTYHNMYIAHEFFYPKRSVFCLLMNSVNIFCMRLMSNNNLIVTKWNQHPIATIKQLLLFANCIYWVFKNTKWHLNFFQIQFVIKTCNSLPSILCLHTNKQTVRSYQNKWFHKATVSAGIEPSETLLGQGQTLQARK